MGNLLTLLRKYKIPILIGASGLLFITVLSVLVVGLSRSAQTPAEDGRRLISIYDRGAWSAFMSDAKTLKEAFDDNGIQLDSHDTVEPALDEELVAPEYQVNIYRARPVTVIDGATKVRVVSPYQAAEGIARDAGVTLYAEDDTKLSQSTDFTGSGAGLQLTISRATPFILDLYGRKSEVRTQGKTVREMLDEKEIKLGDSGRVSVPLEAPITTGMEVRVWREGKQTINIDEAIPFNTEYVNDADRPVGYRVVSTPGRNGVRTISYEVEIKDGVEISRKKIAQIVTKTPSKQVEIVGIKSTPWALTKSKGAQYFTDSKGVSHRETYYDLDMGVVMKACGQGGRYTVRVDGVKIDSDGYVIVAANYGRYPRCTLVETSVGMAKVYDTGGFALRHPTGIDIATDWSNNNGR